MADKKISQLDSTSSVNTGAMFPLSQTEGGSLKTVKGTVDQIGDYIAKEQDHSTLNTVSKKIIGAINEILASGIEGTASGSVASFNDGGDNIPVKSLVAEIVASQAGSGTPSPSNPRAISGYTDVVIKNDVQGATQATYTISLGSTVYGGTLDVVNGVLTIDKTCVTLNPSAAWTKNTGIASSNAYTARAFFDNYKQENGICSHFETVSRATAESGIFFGSNINILTPLDLELDTVEKFAQWITGKNIQVLYSLLTPVVIQLTPTEVVTLLGENNIYANSGDVEVEYFNEDASQFNDLIETIITSSSSDYHVYSTNEKVVGRWIDGKPIYEKTFVFNSSVTIGLVWTATGFTITNGSFIINSTLMRYSNNGTIEHSVNILPSTGAITLATAGDNKNLVAGSTLTVQYTKTTD